MDAHLSRDAIDRNPLAFDPAPGLPELSVGQHRRPADALALPPRGLQPFLCPLGKRPALEFRQGRHHRVDEDSGGGARVDMQVGDLEVDAAHPQLFGFGQGVDDRAERPIQIPHHQHVASLQLFDGPIIDGPLRATGRQRFDMKFIADVLQAQYLPVVALVGCGHANVGNLFHANS